MLTNLNLIIVYRLRIYKSTETIELLLYDHRLFCFTSTYISAVPLFTVFKTAYYQPQLTQYSDKLPVNDFAA